MDVLLISGLLLVGYKLNKDRDNSQRFHTSVRNSISPNEIPSATSTYKSSYLDVVNDKIKQLADIIYPKFLNDTYPKDNNTVYSSVDEKINYLDLKSNIEQQTDGQIKPKVEYSELLGKDILFEHNNMLPFFKGSETKGSLYSEANQSLLENFTGDNPLPNKDIINNEIIYPQNIAPLNVTPTLDRYIQNTSQNLDFYLPFEQQLPTPPNPLINSRIYPKNMNQLQINPLVEYQTPLIDGQKGALFSSYDGKIHQINRSENYTGLDLSGPARGLSQGKQYNSEFSKKIKKNIISNEIFNLKSSINKGMSSTKFSLKPTLRDLNSNITYDGLPILGNDGGYKISNNKSKITNKQTTLIKNYQGNANSQNIGSYQNPIQTVIGNKLLQKDYISIPGSSIPKDTSRSGLENLKDDTSRDYTPGGKMEYNSYNDKKLQEYTNINISKEKENYVGGPNENTLNRLSSGNVIPTNRENNIVERIDESYISVLNDNPYNIDINKYFK
jgi:hypothetical protein